MKKYKTFDQKCFYDLISGDQELFFNLVELFEQDYPSVLKELKSAIATGNLQKIEQTSHRLKGNLRNFYADQAAKLALEIEEASREAQIEGLEKKAQELEAQIHSVQSELRDFYSQWSSDSSHG